MDSWAKKWRFDRVDTAQQYAANINLPSKLILTCHSILTPIKILESHYWKMTMSRVLQAKTFRVVQLHISLFVPL